MTINYTSFSVEALLDGNVLIHPVNCEGVLDNYPSTMHPLLELAPDNHASWLDQCAAGRLHPGEVFPFAQADGTIILNTAYRVESSDELQVGLLRKAMSNVRNFLVKHHPPSVVFPAMGCIGPDKLPWLAYKELLETHLDGLPDGIAVTALLPEDGGAIPKLGDGPLPLDAMFGSILTVNKSFPLDLPELVRNERLRENKAKWVRKVGCYHPSSFEASPCYRALAYDRLGVPPRARHYAQSYYYFDIGNEIHSAIQKRLYAAIARLKGVTFQEEIIAHHPAFGIYGHADGLFEFADGSKWVLEIKTMGKSGFSGLSSPKPTHIRQVHAYMFCLNAPKTVFLYVSRDNGEMRTFVVTYQAKVFRTLAQDIGLVEDILAQGKLPNRKASAWDCKQCKFMHVCNPPIS